ncbi:cytochrome c biogenesis protein [Labedella gwakjiensis]|uniref:Cytochrome c biogenesis protein n=2 Tax=Labedella gwakjiensis TaxID=390269 RepID=A0A2P8GSY3_9MICO|nr:cytochrome c biogenesis protein [Labedella gwakjiensis]
MSSPSDPRPEKPSRPARSAGGRGPSDRIDDPNARPELDGENAESEASSTVAQGDGPVSPKLGVIGSLRFFWRQLTSMKTAILLLLLLAIAAIPGSLVPQRSSDPNGVTQYFTDNPDLAPILDKIQLFDVYSSPWFSAVYILLFISLIGCIIPRTKHHFDAMRARPPRTPARLSRLADHREETYADVDVETALAEARSILTSSRYRVEEYEQRGVRSLSAERGYLRETGNLVFHASLVGVLIAVGVGGGFGYSGQRVVVEGQSFVNSVIDYDSINPGRFFDEDSLSPYALNLDSFDVTYETANLDAYGQPIDFTAHVTTTTPDGESSDQEIKVNHPLRFEGTDVFLLGNGYAPTITVRDPDGKVVFTDSVPFLPQDANLTSIGVVKIPDGLSEQVGMVGFFYPTAQPLDDGAFTSTYPDLVLPILSLNVYTGDLGIDDGVPRSVYTLNTDEMTQVAGRDSDVEAIQLSPGDTAELPNGLGSIEFENANPDAAAGDYSGSVPRFASLDIHNDPSQVWVLVFAVLVVLGLLTSLFVPRRRVWVAVHPVSAASADDTADESGSGVRVEYAGLARGEDPGLADAVDALAYRHGTALGVERP